jgi:hypothetical protein
MKSRVTAGRGVARLGTRDPLTGGEPRLLEQVIRPQRIQVTANPERYLCAYTPEDILLQKLRRFHKGHEASDRQ